jgi:hypothetical protein
MRKIMLCAIFTMLSLCAVAQEHYTQGPVWRVTLIKVKPTAMDAYMTSLRQSTKPVLEEEKKEGIIVDYKVFLKSTKHDPNDWDIALAVQYKSWAAMDGEPAKAEAVRDKVLGGKQPAQQLAEKRVDMREIVTSDLMQEIFLK